MLTVSGSTLSAAAGLIVTGAAVTDADVTDAAVTGAAVVALTSAETFTVNKTSELINASQSLMDENF